MTLQSGTAIYPKTCVIGAGVSGLAAAKALFQSGVPFDCVETSDRVGGNWVFKNKSGLSSAYRSLHAISSKEKLQFSDFAMPAQFPQFLHHAQMAQYLESFVEQFGFRERILFNTTVKRADLTADGLWKLTFDTGELRLYDALVVANGHHWDPRLPVPALPGRFDGKQIHSHNYVDPYDPVSCIGRNVLVVGFGNSALDIAAELGRKGVAKRVLISQRRGYWVAPKLGGGRVADSAVASPLEAAPWWHRMIPRDLAGWAAERAISRLVGRPEAFGLMPPAQPFFATHPAVNHELLLRLASGDVEAKPDVKEFRGRQVSFADNSVEDVDVVIWCTGYNVTFPFFDEGFVSAPDNQIALWKRMIDPRFLNLFFVGLVQPLCGLPPVAEMQAKFVSAYLTGKYTPPPLEVMNAERVEAYEKSRSLHVASPRHTLQIDCVRYAHELKQEMKRGGARAERQQHALPVPPRVVRPAVPTMVEA